jgi:hypothetical protein
MNSAIRSGPSTMRVKPRTACTSRALRDTLRQTTGAPGANVGLDRGNSARFSWAGTSARVRLANFLPEAGMSFEIVAYGSQDARSAGLMTLDDNETAYINANFCVEI